MLFVRLFAIYFLSKLFSAHFDRQFQMPGGHHVQVWKANRYVRESQCWGDIIFVNARYRNHTDLILREYAAFKMFRRMNIFFIPFQILRLLIK